MSQSSGESVAELEKLHAENTRLIALLEAHGIQWQLPPVQPAPPAIAVEHSRLTTVEKVALFRRLFRGFHMAYKAILTTSQKAGIE